MRFMIHTTPTNKTFYYAGSRTPNHVTDVDWVEDDGDATLFRTFEEAESVGLWLERSGLVEDAIAEEFNEYD